MRHCCASPGWPASWPRCACPTCANCGRPCPPLRLTVAVAAKRWLDSRIDHAAGTRIAAQGNINRFLPMLGKRRCDEVTSNDVADLVTELRAKGRKRETIKKSVGALAMTLDHAGIHPNPARITCDCRRMTPTRSGRLRLARSRTCWR